MSNIEILNLSKHFGEKKIFENFTLCFSKGKITCLMGPSGCGKTTLLHILAGLENYEAGEIRGVDDAVAVVFQEDRLCENYSAISNIRLVTDKSVSRETIEEVLQELGLTKGDSAVPVKNLSGGMKRRVAVARAVLYLQKFPREQALLLLDEPFQGLDFETKKKTIEMIKKMTQGMSVLCVTHDSEDVALLGSTCERICNCEN